MARRKKSRGKAPMTLRQSDEAWLMARVIELGRRVDELGIEVERLRAELGALERRIVLRSP